MTKKEILELAKKAGIEVPSGLETRELAYYLADQLGLLNFQYGKDGLTELIRTIEDEIDLDFYEVLDEDASSLEDESDTSSSNEEDEVNEIPEKDEDKEDALTNSNKEENLADRTSIPSPKKDDKEDSATQNENGLDEKDSLQDRPSSKEDSKKEDTKDDSKEKKEMGRNGYNSTKKENSQVPSDGTKYADQNYQHQKRIERGKKQEEESPNKKSPSKKSSPKEKENTKEKKTQTPKKKVGKVADRLNKGKNPFRLKNLKNKIFQFLLSHPALSIILVVSILMILIILIVVIDESGKGGKSGTRCNYELKGIVESGTVSLNDVQVELINCEGTPDNYTVLKTVDFEKYVVGVALAEVGSGSPDEAIKAQIVAARNFALTRNSGMCPGSPSTCFYGYNLATNTIRMRACEADQVYWDYKEDIYRQDRGSISLYSPEVDQSSGTLWQSALSQERINEIETLAEEVRGVVLLDQDDFVLKTPYNATVSQFFQSEASSGKNYEEILTAQYGSDNFHTSVCSSYGFIDYGDYVLDSSQHEILHQDLSSFLLSKGTSLEEFNKLIADNVEDAGFGTRAGVVVSAVTLIGELGNQYGVKIPYYWGGGHGGTISNYAAGNWGSNTCRTYANNQWYSYCGLDCSGFVPWAIYNGGYSRNTAMLAGNFYKGYPGAQRVSLKSHLAVLEPGDLIESKAHITLVVDVDEAAEQYIIAHASGNKTGVLFSRIAFDQPNYWGVKMDGYYNNPANIRSR